MKTPCCYNRDLFTDPYSGLFDLAKLGDWRPKRATTVDRFGRIEEKGIYRYRWPWFTDRCAAWDGPQVSETVPARECWACDGCKWLPAHARAWIRGEDDHD